MSPLLSREVVVDTGISEGVLRVFEDERVVAKSFMLFRRRAVAGAAI